MMVEGDFDYDGFAYVRPVGRGVHLEGDRYVEDLPDGYYRVSLKFERLPWKSDEEAEAKVALHFTSEPVQSPPEVTE